jgi:integrase
MREGVWLPPDSGVYLMKVSVDGVPTRETTGKRTFEEAVAYRKARLEELRRGDSVPHEARLALDDLRELICESYDLRENKSKATMLSTWKHLTAFFGPKCKATRIGARTEKYVAHRKAEGAKVGSIRIELALLDRAFNLAVQKKRLSHRARPYIEKPPVDPTAVRKGFFYRADIERLIAPCDCSEMAKQARSWSTRTRRQRPDITPCSHLAPWVAAVIEFLFFCPWRIGGARRLEWRDFNETEGVLTLRAENNKTGYELRIPVDAENTPELMSVIERQKKLRRPHCPYIFHGRDCGTRKNGRPCLGSIRKAWDTRCEAIGMAGRTPHDLRRSGVKHYKLAGVDLRVVMAWSGHRTMSMANRYHIIDLDDLRRAGKKASEYQGPAEVVRPMSEQRRSTVLNAVTVRSLQPAPEAAAVTVRSRSGAEEAGNAVRS